MIQSDRVIRAPSICGEKRSKIRLLQVIISLQKCAKLSLKLIPNDMVEMKSFLLLKNWENLKFKIWPQFWLIWKFFWRISN